MKPKKKRIFISYSTKDDEISDKWISSFAGIFEKEVEAISPGVADVFFAPNSIEAGEEWRSKYLSRLDDGLDIMIAFISPSYFNSEYCMEEIVSVLNQAEDGWQGRIIPVFFNGKKDFWSNQNGYEQEQWDIIQKVNQLNYLDWRKYRFTSISDYDTRKQISELAIKVGDFLSSADNDSTAALPKLQFHGIPEISSAGAREITAAQNDDVFVRQEHRYNEALSNVIKQCVSRQNLEKELIFLELDYRNPEGISAHLSLYKQIGYELGQVFVLCENMEQADSITTEENIEVTPFVLDGAFSAENLIACWESNGFPNPDIIYSDRNYRRLQDPVSDYIQIRRRLLSEKGAIIIKGFDDGSKICYPDDDCLLDDIIKMTANKANVSDRYNGRKIYNRFKLAGFSDFYCEYIVNDTIEMSIDDRYDLYEESFEFRKNYFDENSEERKIIENKLLQLRNRFCETSFYYCETNFFIGASKGDGI